MNTANVNLLDILGITKPVDLDRFIKVIQSIKVTAQATHPYTERQAE